MVNAAGQGPRYTEADFDMAHVDKQCDLVMKGGVTSGVVYPYAVLQLAQEYRLRSIGGTSAGAIAAAFAAAAEYGRQSGDKAAFVRLEERCLELPGILEGLFQPSRPFEPLMRALKRWSAVKGWTRPFKAVAPFWPSLAGGALVGVAAMLALGGLLGIWLDDLGWASALPGVLLGGLVGVAAGVSFKLLGLFLGELPRHNFGICSGMAAPGGPPVLTDWIHRSLQYLAFGDEAAYPPLTFGHLANVGPQADAGRSIVLKMMTTNLSMRRPHVLPEMGDDFWFEPSRWKRLMPADVMRYLDGASPHTGKPVAASDPKHPGMVRSPAPDDWPVVAAVRMSLSFPVLLEAVPMKTIDLAPVAAKVGLDDKAKLPPLEVKDVVFSDGGLTSNFPIHFFDAFLPTRPTFALSLDELPASEAEGAGLDRRVTMPQTAAGGSFSPIHAVASFPQFFSAISDSARGWQDQLLGELPGQRERIVRVRLKPDEGGLNLAMPIETSRALMAYGDRAGELMRTQFNFAEHKWRRTLVSYRALEKAVNAIGPMWPAYGDWFDSYAPKSYKRVTVGDRQAIGARFGRFAGLQPDFTPIPGQKKFPQPEGRLRIVPDV